mmetsp:Transcript_56677/g.137784  ORF Transcript_56677/g.137784 Transcript_56677/m.137784 type:complete len:1013 (-) Transcript_56677:2372-5410(-)
MGQKVWTECVESKLKDERRVIEAVMPKLHETLMRSSMEEVPKNGIDGGEEETETKEVEGSQSVVKGHPKGLESAGVINDDLSSSLSSLSVGEMTSNLGFERLVLAFRELFRTIAQQGTVVLFIDDVQWASKDTVEILRALLKEKESRRLLVIEAHRALPPDAAKDTQPHPLHSFRDEFSSISTSVYLNELSVKDITELLSRLLRRDETDVADLATLLHQKTGGNAFFLKQILVSLETTRQALLHYSLTQFRWEFDVDKIKEETSISSNIVDFVLGKISDQPFTEILILASALGSTFIEVDVLCRINPPERSLTKGRATKLLDDAVDEGILESVKGNRNKFCHDRILEGFQSLLPSGKEKISLHMDIGQKLWRLLDDRTLSLDQTQREQLLFQAASQLNMESRTFASEDLQQCLRWAELNYKAAMAARKRSSYFPALDFVKTGMRIITRHDKDPWVNHKSFMLKSGLLCAKLEYLCGNPHESIEAADVILSQAESLKDKHMAARTKLFCLDQLRKRDEGFKFFRSILSEFGVKIPRRFVTFHILKHYLKIKKMIGPLSDNDILNMPDGDDDLGFYRSEFMPRLGEMALSWGIPELMTLAMILAIETTFRKGRSPVYAQVLVVWGSIMAQEGNFREALRFAKLAEEVIKAKRGGTFDERAILLNCVFVRHWVEPYQLLIEPSSMALKNLWKVGDLETVFYDTSTYLRLYFVSGLKIEELEKDILKFADLCSFFHQESCLGPDLALFQMVSNLLGRSTNPTKLKGDFMDEDYDVKEWADSGLRTNLLNFYFHSAMIKYIFNEYEAASEMTAKMTDIFHEGTDIFVPTRVYFKGLVAFALARKTKKRKYVRAGANALRTLEKWFTNGAVSCHHLVLALKAEQESVDPSKKRKSEDIRESYDKAIVVCAKLGFLYDHAILNERAGMFHLDIDEFSYASTYLERALYLFSDWGAHSKNRQMEERYSNIFAQSGSSEIRKYLERSKSTGLKGKARLDDMNTREMMSLGLSHSSIVHKQE